MEETLGGAIQRGIPSSRDGWQERGAEHKLNIVIQCQWVLKHQKSIVRLYRRWMGPGNSLLAVMEAGFRLTTWSSVGRPTTRQVLTAQTPHTTRDVWGGQRGEQGLENARSS